MRGKLFMSFIKYVSQSVMGMVGISCYILADTWFVAAALGAEGLAALNLAIVFYSLLNAAGLMAGIGGATLFSLSLSSGRRGRSEIFRDGHSRFRACGRLYRRRTFARLDRADARRRRGYFCDDGDYLRTILPSLFLS
ncbi:MAG: hypothetical protein ACLUEQ_08495 [Cloacibacillus evryensis]